MKLRSDQKIISKQQEFNCCDQLKLVNPSSHYEIAEYIHPRRQIIIRKLTRKLPKVCWVNHDVFRLLSDHWLLNPIFKCFVRGNSPHTDAGSTTDAGSYRYADSNAGPGPESDASFSEDAIEDAIEDADAKVYGQL